MIEAIVEIDPSFGSHLREDKMFEFPLTPELFGFLFGAVLSVLLAWVPFLNTWFAGLNDELRKGLHLGLSLLLAVFLGFSSCQGWFEFVPCDKSGFLHLGLTWAAFLFGNLGAYKVAPKAEKVQALLKK